MDLLRTFLSIVLVSVVLIVILTNWKGATSVLTAGGNTSNTLIRTLQGR